MLTKSFALLPLAEIDLEEIWFYTFQNWSLAQADSDYREIVVAFEGLASGTKRGREVEVRPDYLKYPVGSHMIYFRVSSDQIEVVQVLH